MAFLVHTLKDRVCCTVGAADVPNLAVVQQLQISEWSRVKPLLLAEHVALQRKEDATGHAEGYLSAQGRPH